MIIYTNEKTIHYHHSHNPSNTTHPLTTEAPILELTWPGELDPQDTIRYTPYGIWENTTKTQDGLAYEPANEMQFYMSTDATDYLAVAPGIITRSETHNGPTDICD